MNTICSICFSPSGNTKKIIHELLQKQEEIKHISFDITLKQPRQDLVEAIHSLNVKPDYWIIGCPVYYGRIPALVIEQIQKLNGSNIPTLALVTYGNKSYGIALNQLQKELQKQNFKVVGLGAFIGEHSFSGKFHIAENRPDHFDIKRIHDFGKTLFSTPHSNLDKDCIKGKIDFVARIMPAGGPKPFVNSEQCIHCQICVKNCPLDLIGSDTKMYKDMKSEKKCLSCMSCVKRCPENARNYTLPKVIEFILNRFYFNKSKKERKEAFML